MRAVAALIIVAVVGVLLGTDIASGRQELVAALGLAGAVGAVWMPEALGRRHAEPIDDRAPAPAWELPEIHDAAPALAHVLDVDDLDAMVAPATGAALPARLRLMARGLRSHANGRCGPVLLDAPGRQALAIAEATALAAEAPLLSIAIDELVSRDIAFPLRAMTTLLRDAERHTPAVVMLHGLDALARAAATPNGHRARRAVNDVLAAVRRAEDAPDLLIMAASASVGTLDRSVVDAFEHVVTPAARRWDVAVTWHTDVG